MPSPPTQHDHMPEEERATREAALDQTIEGSFPASDPPSSNPNPYDHTALERRGLPPGADAEVIGGTPGEEQ
jgi:hypothetical protein